MYPADAATSATTAVSSLFITMQYSFGFFHMAILSTHSLGRSSKKKSIKNFLLTFCKCQQCTSLAYARSYNVTYADAVVVRRWQQLVISSQAESLLQTIGVCSATALSFSRFSFFALREKCKYYLIPYGSKQQQQQLT